MSIETLVILIVVGVVILGPTKLPDYIRQLMKFVRDLRRMFLNAQTGLERETGMSMEDLKKYDPRQYDPRKIVRDAWNSPLDDDDMAALERGKQNALTDVKDGVAEVKGSAQLAAGTVAGAVSTVRDALLLKDVSDKPEPIDATDPAKDESAAETTAADATEVTDARSDLTATAEASSVDEANSAAEASSETAPNPMAMPKVPDAPLPTASVDRPDPVETNDHIAINDPAESPANAAAVMPAAFTPVVSTFEYTDEATGEVRTRETVRSAYSVAQENLESRGAPSYSDAT